MGAHDRGLSLASEGNDGALPERKIHLSPDPILRGRSAEPLTLPTNLGGAWSNYRHRVSMVDDWSSSNYSQDQALCLKHSGRKS